MPIVDCAYCGGGFEVKPCRADEAKFCSQECYGKDKRGEKRAEYDTYTCGYCGDEFEALESRDRNYCSEECNINSQKKRVTLTCPICKSDFEVIEAESDRRVCCSRECMGKYRSKHYVGENHHNYKERREVDCWACGTTLTRQQYRFKYSDNHFCDHDCYAEYVSEVKCGENHYKYKPDELTEYGPGWNEEKRERVRKRDNRECQECGSEATGHFEKLDVHHIRPADTFDDPQKRNAMENLISLCRSCHPKWEKMAPLRPDN